MCIRDRYKDDTAFKEELKDLLENYAGRPSLLYYAERMTRDLGGAKVYLKREDLNHTGSHKDVYKRQILIPAMTTARAAIIFLDGFLTFMVSSKSFSLLIIQEEGLRDG